MVMKKTLDKGKTYTKITKWSRNELPEKKKMSRSKKKKGGKRGKV